MSNNILKYIIAEQTKANPFKKDTGNPFESQKTSKSPFKSESEALGTAQKFVIELAEDGRYANARNKAREYFSGDPLSELLKMVESSIFADELKDLSIEDACVYIYTNWKDIESKGINPKFQLLLLQIQELLQENKLFEALELVAKLLKDKEYTYKNDKKEEKKAKLSGPEIKQLKNFKKSLISSNYRQLFASQLKLKGFETAFDALKGKRSEYSKEVETSRFEDMVISTLFEEKGRDAVIFYIDKATVTVVIHGVKKQVPECKLSRYEKKEAKQDYEIQQLIKDKKYAEAEALAQKYFGDAPKKIERQLEAIYTAKLMDEAGKLDSEAAIRYLEAHREEYEAKGINIDFYVIYFEIQGLLQDGKYSEAANKINGLLKSGEYRKADQKTRLQRDETGKLLQLKKNVDEHHERVAIAWKRSLTFEGAESWIKAPTSLPNGEAFDLSTSFELLTLDLQELIEARNYDPVEKDITTILEEGHYGEKKTRIDAYERKGLENLLVSTRMAKITDEFKKNVEEKGFEDALKEFEAKKEEYIKLIGEELYDKIIISVMMDEKGQGLKAVQKYIIRMDVVARWSAKDIEEEMELFCQSQEIEGLLKQERFDEAKELAEKYFHTDAGYEESSYDDMVEAIYSQKLIKELEDMSLKQAIAYVKEHTAEYTEYDVNVDFYLLLIKVQELAANKQYAEAETLLNNALVNGSFKSLFLAGKEIKIKDNEVLRLAAQLSGLRAARTKEEYLDIFVEKGWAAGTNKLETNSVSLTTKLGSEFRYKRFTEEVQIAAKQQLEGVDSAIAYIKEKTSALRELGIEPNDLLERLEVEKLLEDEKLDEAITKAKEYFADKELDRMLEIIHTQKTAKALEDLVTSEAKEYLETNRADLETVDVDVDFQLYMLDIQSSFQKKEYNQVIEKLEAVLKDEVYGQGHTLKSNNKRNIQLMLIRAKAMQIIEDNAGKEEKAITFIDDVLAGNGDLGFDVKSIEKEIKSLRESLIIQEKSQASAETALKYLRENETQVVIALGGGEKGKKAYTEQLLQLQIQDIQEREGMEAAWKAANQDFFKQEFERVSSKKDLNKYLVRLEFSKKLKDSLQEAKAFVGSKKTELTSKDLKYFGAQLEISGLAEQGSKAYRKIIALIKEKESDYREAGVNVDAVIKQYEFQLAYEEQGSGKALEYLKANTSDLKKAGMNIESLTFELELEKLLSEGSEKEGDIAKKFEDLKSPETRAIFLKELKEAKPELYEDVNKLLAAGKIEEAADLIGSLQAEGKVSQRVLASTDSYIRHLRTEKETQFVVTIQIKSPIDPFESVDPIKAEEVTFSYTAKGIDQYSAIFNLQTMLMEVEDENGLPYLSGIPGVTFEWGKIDGATINALYRFKNRTATQVTEKQITQGYQRTLYDKTEKKPIGLTWGETDEGALIRTYAESFKIPQSLLHIFMYTKLGLAFVKNGAESSGTELLHKMADYLEQKTDKPEEKQAYKRIKEALTGKGELQNNDLTLFYRACSDDTNIDEDNIKEHIEHCSEPTGLKETNDLPQAFKLKYTVKLDDRKKYLGLDQALDGTKIGKALHTHANRLLAEDLGKLDKFNKTDFILCLLIYLIKADPENQAAYGRIKDNYINSGVIVEEDLKTLSERIAKVDIYPELVAKAFTEYQEMSVDIKGFAVMPKVRMVDGSFIPVSVKEAAEATPALADLREMPPGKLYGYKLYRLLALKKQWLQMGIALASGDPQDAVLTPLTPADLLKAADWMEKNKSDIRVHYPIYLDKELRAYLASIEKNDLLYPLAQRFLSSDIREVLKQEKAQLESKDKKTEQDEKRIRLLDKLIKNEDQLIRTIMMASQVGIERVDFDKDNALDAQDIAWLRSLEEKRKKQEKLYITQEEYTFLQRKAEETHNLHLKLLVGSIKPDDAYSFNQAEIDDLRIMAKDLTDMDKDNIDTQTLAEYMQAHPENKGAKALWQRTQIVGLGAMETQRKWYEISPNIITTGLQAKPQRANLVFLKRQWAKTKACGLADKVKGFRAEIDSLTKQIKEIKPDSSELDSLVRQRWLLQQQLDYIIDKIESDTVTKEFIEWFIDKHLKADGVFGQASKWVFSQARDELYKEFYYDFTTGQRMRNHDARNLVVENTAVIFKMLENDTLFSLDAVAEGNHSEESLFSFKQALAASINLAVTPEHITETAEKAGYPAEDNLSLEVKSLKTMTVNYYGTFLRFQHPDDYYNYMFGDNPGVGVIMKYDIEILTKVLPGIGIEGEKQELAKLEQLLKNDSAFNSDGSLKEEHYDLLKKIGKKLNMAQGKDEVTGTKGKIVTDIETSGGLMEYMLPPTNSEWGEETLYNLSQLPGDNWGTKILNQVANSNVAGEVAMKLVWQQVMFRFFMLKWIYVDLSKEVINQLIDGEGLDKLSGAKYLFQMFFWRSMAFIWYREFFEEIKQGHYGNALAIWYAINYLTMMGGQRSIWANTLALDAKMAGAIVKYIPGGRKLIEGLNRKFPNAMKGFARRGFLTSMDARLFNGAINLLKLDPKIREYLRENPDSKFAKLVNSRWSDVGALRAVIELFGQAGTRKAYAEKGKEKVSSKVRRLIFQALKGTTLSPWLVTDYEARQAVQSETPWVRNTGRVWTFPMDYAFGLGEHAFDLAFRRGLGLALSATRNELSTRAHQHANNGSFHVNPTELAAEAIIERGKVKISEAGEHERNKNISKEIEQAKKQKGDFADLLQYDPKRKGFFIEWNGQQVEVTKVRIVESGKADFVLERPHGAPDADCKIWLLLPKDYNPQTLTALKERIRVNGEVKPKTTTKLPVLSGNPLDPVQNQAYLDEVKPSSLEARRLGIDLAKNYKDKPADFWVDYRGAAEQYRAGKIPSAEMSKWAVAAAKFATEKRTETGKLEEAGKNVRLVQQQSTEILSAPGNHLIHLETGGGKSLIDILTIIQLSSQYKKMYLFTSGDHLVEQMSKDSLIKVLTGAGLKVNFLYTKNPVTKKAYTPEERQKIYNANDVVVVDISSHAFDLGGGQVKIIPGATIGDEWDQYAIESGTDTYTVAGPKGQTQNMFIDATTLILLRRKWNKAHNCFKKIMFIDKKTGEMKVNPRYIDPETGEFTAKGIKLITREMGSYNAFVQMQFEALRKATTLYREKELGQEAKLSHEIKFKVVKKGRRIIDIIPLIPKKDKDKKDTKASALVPLEEGGGESPDKRFGNGLDEALRLVYGLKIERDTITVADIDIMGVFKHHKKNVGLSGSLNANHELIGHTYKGLNFRVVEIPPYIPRAEIGFSDSKTDVAKKLEKLAVEAEETLKLGDIGAHTKEVVGKIYVYGIDATEAQKIWDTEILPKHPTLAGKKLSIVKRNNIFIYDADARRKAAVEEAVATAKTNRPAFIVLETPEQFDKYMKELGQREGVHIQTFTGEDFGENKQEIERIKAETRKNGSYKLGNYKFRTKRGKLFAFEKGQRVKGNIIDIIREAKIAQAGQAGTITVTYFSRGLDIQVQMLNEAIARAGEASLLKGGTDATFAEGGLHVSSAGAKTLAKILQSIGRGARNYFPGTSSIYTGYGDAVFEHLDKTTELEPLEQAAGGKDKAVNLYDPKNKEINDTTETAYRREYQQNFESMQRQFEQSALKSESLATIGQLSSNLADFNSFYQVAIDAYVDFVLQEAGINSDADLKDYNKMLELERKLSEVLNGRKVELGRTATSRAILAKAISNKIFNIFRLNTTEGALDGYSTQEFEYIDENGKPRKITMREMELRELVGESYSLVVDGKNAIERLNLENQDKDFKQVEMDALGKRVTASLLEKIWGRMFFRGIRGRGYYHAMKKDLNVTAMDFENAQREISATPATEKNPETKTEGRSLKGEITTPKGVYTYKADSQGRFYAYDSTGKAIGRVEFDTTGKMVKIRRFHSLGLRSAAEPVSLIILSATDIVARRPKKAEFSSAEAGAQTTSLSSADFERATQARTQLTQLEPLAFLSDIAVDKFASLTAKDIRLLQGLAKYTGKKSIKQADYLRAEKMLREKLGVDAAEFIETCKLKRVRYFYNPARGFNTLKEILTGKLIGADVEMVWKNLLRMGRSSQAEYRDYFALELGIETSAVEQLKEIGHQKVLHDEQKSKKAQETFLNYLENAEQTLANTPTVLADQIKFMKQRISFFKDPKHGAERMKKFKVTETQLSKWEATISPLETKLASVEIPKISVQEADKIETDLAIEKGTMIKESTFVILDGVTPKLLNRVHAGNAVLNRLLRANGVVEVKIENRGGKEYSIERINPKKVETFMALVEEGKLADLAGAKEDKAAYLAGQEAYLELAKILIKNNPHLNISEALQLVLSRTKDLNSIPTEITIPLLADFSSKDPLKALQLIDAMQILERAKVVAEERAKGGNWQEKAEKRIKALVDFEKLKDRAVEKVLDNYHGLISQDQLLATAEGRAEIEAAAKELYLQDTIDRWEKAGMKPEYIQHLRKIFKGGKGNGFIKKIGKHPIFSSSYSPAKEMLLGALVDPLVELAVSFLKGKELPSVGEMGTASLQGAMHWGVFGAKRGMFMYTAGIAEGRAIHRVMLFDVAKGIAIAPAGEEGHAAFASVTSLGALIGTMKYLEASPKMLAMMDKVKLAKHLPLLLAMVAAELAGDLGELFWKEQEYSGLGQSITFVAKGLKPIARIMTPVSTVVHEMGLTQLGPASGWALDTTATLADIVIWSKITYPMLMAGGTYLTTGGNAALAYEAFTGASATVSASVLAGGAAVAGLAAWITLLIDIEMQDYARTNGYDLKGLLKVQETIIPRINQCIRDALGQAGSLGSLINTESETGSRNDILLEYHQLGSSPTAIIQLLMILTELGYINENEPIIRALKNAITQSSPNPEAILGKIAPAYQEYLGISLLPYTDPRTGQVLMPTIAIDEDNPINLNDPATREYAEKCHQRRIETLNTLKQALKAFRRGQQTTLDISKSAHNYTTEAGHPILVERSITNQNLIPDYEGIKFWLLQYYEEQLDQLFSDKATKGIKEHITAIQNFLKGNGIGTLKDLFEKISLVEETQKQIKTEISRLEDLTSTIGQFNIEADEIEGLYYLVLPDKTEKIAVIVNVTENAGQLTMFIIIPGYEEPITVPINGMEEVNPSYILTLVKEELTKTIKTNIEQLDTNLENIANYLKSLTFIEGLVEYSKKSSPEVKLVDILKNYQAHLLKPIIEERDELSKLAGAAKGARPTGQKLLDLSGVFTTTGATEIFHPDSIPQDFVKWLNHKAKTEKDESPIRIFTKSNALDWHTAYKMLILYKKKSDDPIWLF